MADERRVTCADLIIYRRAWWWRIEAAIWTANERRRSVVPLPTVCPLPEEPPRRIKINFEMRARGEEE